MSTREELEQKIELYAEKLQQLSGAEDKRVKKRVLQALGKLKRKLADLPIDSEFNNLRNNKIEASAPYTQGQAKMKLKLLNKELALLAQKKQLKLAKKRFNWGKKKGLPVTIHTYANMLNACVRCGEMEEAESFVLQMCNDGICHNIVSLTILIKGYSDRGDINKAWQLLHEVEMINGKSTTRSLNTFLRGCQRIGAVDLALTASSGVRTEIDNHQSSECNYDNNEIEEVPILNVASEITTKPTIVSLLCQSFRIQQAEALISTSLSSPYTTALGENENAMDRALMCVSLIRSLSLLGLVKDAQNWASEARILIEKAKTSQLREAMYLKLHSVETAAEAPSMSRSMQLFLQHRREELRINLDTSQDYILRLSKIPMFNATSIVQLQISILFDHFSRLLYFGTNGFGDIVSSQGILSTSFSNSGEYFMYALRDKFGLDHIKKALVATSDDFKSNESGTKHLKRMKTLLCKKLLAVVDSSTGYISFPRLFQPLQDDCSIQALSKLPINLEIGAGTGEWIASQAAVDCAPLPSWPLSTHNDARVQHHVRALWIGMELRCDRLYDMLCHGIFSCATSRPMSTPLALSGPLNLNNLAYIGGDASTIIHNHFEPESISSAFINHPEPPEHTSGGEGNQGRHLLTTRFFTILHRILKPNGTITIVTDNLPYAQLLISIIEDMIIYNYRNGTGAFCSVSLPSDDSRTIESEVVVSNSANKRPRKEVLATNKTWETSSNDLITTNSDDYDINHNDDSESSDDDNSNCAVSMPYRHGNQSSPLNEESVDTVQTKLGSPTGGASVERRIQLWRGDRPGPELGHVVESSSYFDRMWARGEKKKRWFLYLNKC